MAAGPGRASTNASRACWVAVAAVPVAFAVFEVVAHPGPTLWLGVIGALAPDVPRLVARWWSARVVDLCHRLTHLPVLPVALLAWYCLNADTNDEAAPGFTLALLWLAHIAAGRAIGRGHVGSGVTSGASLIPDGPHRPTIGA